MVLGIQVAGLLFGIFMIYYSFLHFKRKEFNKKEFALWIILWICFILVALFPNLLDPFVIKLGFFRTLDLLIISGFIFMIAMAFYTYTITKKNQKQLENVVREIALQKKK